VYETVKAQLEKAQINFNVHDALTILESVKQEGVWATRVSFAYSVFENKIYYVLNSNFNHILAYQFP
jgi:hypothetical protein